MNVSIYDVYECPAKVQLNMLERYPAYLNIINSQLKLTWGENSIWNHTLDIVQGLQCTITKTY